MKLLQLACLFPLFVKPTFSLEESCSITADPTLVYGGTIVDYTLATQDNIVVNVDSTPLSKEDTFEAVVYAAKDGDCDDTVLGKSPGARVKPGVTVPSSLPFTVVVTPGTAKITAPVDSFNDPVTYKQVSSCSHDIGSNVNTPGDVCGVLEVCVEYQQQVCGENIVSLDVYIEVEFDLTVERGDFFLATIQRAATVGEGFDVDAIPIKVELCDIPSGIDPVFHQGEVIDICVGYDVPAPVPPGICMLDVDYKFIVKNYPTDGATTVYNLDPLPPGWYYGPGGETCSNPFNPFTECHLPFIPTGVFDLLVPGMEFEVYLDVMVLTGYGCYCDTVDANDNGIPDTCEISTRRQLMGSGMVQQTDSVEIVLSNVGEQNNGGCAMLDFGCWISVFLESLLSLLSFVGLL